MNVCRRVPNGVRAMMPEAGSAQLSVGSVGGLVGGPRAAFQSTGQACAKTEWGQGLVASGLVWQGLLGWLETDQADIRLWHCEPLRGGIDLVLHRGVVVARHSSLPDGRGVRRGFNQRDASGTVHNGVRPGIAAMSKTALACPTAISKMPQPYSPTATPSPPGGHLRCQTCW